jgi:hypothetical protein
MITKLLPAIILTIFISLFNTGCKTYSNGAVESGTRTNILLGLVDFQKDYSIDGEFKGYLLEEKPIESDTYTALRGITSFSEDRNHDLDGTKVSLLWGLFSFKD